MSANSPISTKEIKELDLVHRGKVRDIYQIDEATLLLVATDRISAFDCIFPTPIPNKGKILTALSAFWFDFLEDAAKNHLITTNLDEMPKKVKQNEHLRGRVSLVKMAKVFPVELVVRGYLEGSGWKDYQATGEICGHQLPKNLKHCQRLPEPILTPATKAQSGHDENISEKDFETIVGTEHAEKLKKLSLNIYEKASEYARTRGIIIADTKFEFGLDADGEIILVDEVLTPDSSRFWSADDYQPGQAQKSFDKQFVREYLETLDWNKKPPAPALPQHIVGATISRYSDAYKILTGAELTENLQN